LNQSVLSQIPESSSVVIIRLRSLGDTVLTTPAVALLKQHRPDLRIHMAVEKPFDELLEGNPDLSGILRIAPGARLAQRWKLLGEIRGTKPALCLNAHGGSTSAWLTLLSGARFRAGYAHYRMRPAYNVTIPRAQEVLGREADAPVHTAEHHAAAMFHLGVPPKEIPRAKLHGSASPLPKPYAVLHVTAAYFTKQWEASKFREIAALLRDRHGLDPVVIAGPGEGETLREFDGFTCLDRTSIADLKALIGGSDFFVGNDSGPAHIAAAFEIPSVVIFGSSNSAVWGPWRAPHAVVETAWDCKPCPGDRCYAYDEPRCILSVETAAVAAAIARLRAGEGEFAALPSTIND
jgi:ADP-heptose:LPS heptosyltransferase